MRNLTGIVLEDGLRGLTRCGIKKHDRCHVLPKWFSNTCNLLCQYPHTDAVMARTEAKIDQLTRAAFYVFRSGAVIENKECVCFLKQEARQFEPAFDLMLHADNHKDARILIHEAVVSFILNKGGAEENDVVKLPPEGAS